MLWCYEDALRLMKLCCFKKAYKLNFIKRIYTIMNFFLNKHQNDYFDDTLECSLEKFLKITTLEWFCKLSFHDNYHDYLLAPEAYQLSGLHFNGHLWSYKWIFKGHLEDKLKHSNKRNSCLIFV